MLFILLSVVSTNRNMWDNHIQTACITSKIHYFQQKILSHSYFDRIYICRTSRTLRPIIHVHVISFFSLPGGRPCELLPSLGRPLSVVFLTIFQKSSPLTLLDQSYPNLVWIFFSIELLWGILIRWKTWPLLLKIEHKGQTVVFLHISPKLFC